MGPPTLFFKSKGQVESAWEMISKLDTPLIHLAGMDRSLPLWTQNTEHRCEIMHNAQKCLTLTYFYDFRLFQ